MPATGSLSRRELLRALGAAGGAVAVSALGGACDVREFARTRGAKQRLSIASGQIGGVYYVYAGGVAAVITRHVRNVEATAEVTGAAGDNLRFLRAGRADLAFTIAPTLDDAYRGTGAFARFGRVPANALAVLYAQPMHLVTLAHTGIRSIAGLRGRVVSLQTPGSGSRDVALRMLRAAGLDPASDIRDALLGPTQSAEALKDGKIDAFLTSNAVPSAAIIDLATTLGGRLRLVPNDDVLPALARAYGGAAFFRMVIPRMAYPGLTADVPAVGVATLLVVDARLSELLAYEITRALFDHKAELVAVHPVAGELRPESAARGSPVPFHPGAVRFYKEAGAWTA